MTHTGTSTFTPGITDERPLTLYFVRHGQAEQIGFDELRGPGLTDMGKKQAERTARRLAPVKFSYAYTSSMHRARETAEFIHAYHKEVELTVTDDLREVSHYLFLPDLMPSDTNVRENIRTERDALLRFANRIRHQHSPGENILVACHGNVLRSLLPILGGREPGQNMLMEFNNASVSIMNVWLNGEAILMLGNCVNHLLARQVT